MTSQFDGGSTNNQELAFHYVCTRDQARELLRNHDRFWVMNCGCREARGQCARSRMDVCLMFKGDIAGSGSSGVKEISRVQVEDIFKEAEDKHLVTRPFRNESNMAETDGICFCCDDCCGYFLDPEEVCDRGALVESTDSDRCTSCGTCAEVCYFNARELEHDDLKVDPGNCYGCGLCIDVCPEGSVRMVPRP